jgi:hypothetical protein
MANEFDPIVDEWYSHLDKGQRFCVTAVDEENATVEVQHFDGDVEEFTMDEWRELDIELSVEPENWSGAMDIGDNDDLGTEITDTSAEDWEEPGEDFRDSDQERLTRRTDEADEDSGDGYMEESYLD